MRRDLIALVLNGEERELGRAASVAVCLLAAPAIALVLLAGMVVVLAGMILVAAGICVVPAMAVGSLVGRIGKHGY